MSVCERGSTPGSSRYASTSSPSIQPRPYWPRTTDFGPGVCIARSTFTFSFRTASAEKSIGGSIAVSARSCRRWFWKMSLITPACS